MVSCFLNITCELVYCTTVCVMQDDRDAMLSYSFKVSLSLIQNRKFRRTVHESLVKLYNELGVPDLISVCQVSSLFTSSVLADVTPYKQKRRTHVGDLTCCLNNSLNRLKAIIAVTQ